MGDSEWFSQGKNGQEQSHAIRGYGSPNPARYNWGDTLIPAVIFLAHSAVPGSLRPLENRPAGVASANRPA
jgi:hypothetical protein